MDGLFYTVIRLFFKGEQETHSMQNFATFGDAQVQMYKNLAADLQASGVDYNAGYILASDGRVMDWKVFDRRVVPDITE